MSDTRLFIASSDLFSDFQCEIHLYRMETMNDIIQTFVNHLEEVLTKHKFSQLLEKLKRKKFHIHEHTFEDILTSEPETVFYVCDHE